MHINLLDPADTRHETICDVYSITGIDSFAELLKIRADYQSQYPDYSILLTLDDLGQAQYTSMHAKSSHDLDDIEGYDLSSVDKSAFENGEHIGYLTTKSEFFIRKGNFEKKIQDISFADVCAEGITIDDELDVLESINLKPEALLDTEVLMMIVPVADSALALCAFPNGYFSCDLNPFQNYALAKYLHVNYQYQLLGIGASCIGFIRHETLKSAEIEKLAIDVAKLYQCEDDAESIRRFAKMITDNQYLFLKYTESLDM